ncbi:MAG TPA: hypothetical protein VG756_11320 [Pseudonocardiaceae bacterium]|nr:hypothetical protein [Pseudonocardiaceae bacterium]
MARSALAASTIAPVGAASASAGSGSTMSAPATSWHASVTSRAVPAWAARSCSTAIRRPEMTRSAVSLTAVNTPWTVPLSSCSGL